jgi:hypothetical protein
MPTPTEILNRINEAVDNLRYINYCTNRVLSPHIPIVSWTKIYGEDVYKYETLFNAEQSLKEVK